MSFEILAVLALCFVAPTAAATIRNPQRIMGLVLACALVAITYVGGEPVSLSIVLVSVLGVAAGVRGFTFEAMTTYAWIVLLLTLVEATWAIEGERLIGIAGNPNRMVFDLAIAAPFLLFQIRRPLGRLAVAFVLLWLVWRSGSAQAGLLVGAFGVGLSTLRRGRSPWKLSQLIKGVGVLGFAAVVLRMLSTEADLSRLPIASAILSQEPTRWIFGNGSTTVLVDGLERSTHNAFAALALAGGLSLLLLLAAAITSVRWVDLRSYEPALYLALLALAALSLAQATQASEPAWFLVSAAVAYRGKLDN